MNRDFVESAIASPLTTRSGCTGGLPVVG